MAQYARCMGNAKNAEQCSQCARYPQTVEQEEGSQWLNPGLFPVPCNKYIAQTYEKEAGKKDIPQPMTAQAIDVASIHEMIDLAARFAFIKSAILASCDEIEATARYQLSLAASIREALSA